MPPEAPATSFDLLRAKEAASRVASSQPKLFFAITSAVGMLMSRYVATMRWNLRHTNFRHVSRRAVVAVITPEGTKKMSTPALPTIWKLRGSKPYEPVAINDTPAAWK
jgi:hypothetical protein